MALESQTPEKSCKGICQAQQNAKRIMSRIEAFALLRNVIHLNDDHLISCVRPEKKKSAPTFWVLCRFLSIFFMSCSSPGHNLCTAFALFCSLLLRIPSNVREHENKWLRHGLTGWFNNSPFANPQYYLHHLVTSLWAIYTYPSWAICYLYKIVACECAKCFSVFFFHSEHFPFHNKSTSRLLLAVRNACFLPEHQPALLSLPLSA